MTAATVEAAFVPADEAATELGMHVETVRQFLRDGELHGHKPRGRWEVWTAVLPAFKAGLTPRGQAAHCWCGGRS